MEFSSQSNAFQEGVQVNLAGVDIGRQTLRSRWHASRRPWTAVALSGLGQHGSANVAETTTQRGLRPAKFGL